MVLINSRGHGDFFRERKRRAYDPSNFMNLPRKMSVSDGEHYNKETVVSNFV